MVKLNENKYLNLFLVSIFLTFFYVLSIKVQSQTDLNRNFNNNNDVAQKFYITLSGGVHWGDNRLSTKPIIFGGLGYYLSNGLSLKIEYTPVIVMAKNNNYPFFRYNGIELQKGDKITIDELFISLETKFYSNLWFGIGIAPEELFSIKAGGKYNWFLNKNVIIYFEYSVLCMGRPISNSANHSFVNNLFLIGISFFPY